MDNMCVSPAGVVEAPSDAPLKETLAPFTGENAIVLAAGFVPAHHAVHHAGLVLLANFCVAVPRPGRAALLLPPQVTFLTESISAAVGVGPSPAHHGHLCVHQQELLEKPSGVENSQPPQSESLQAADSKPNKSDSEEKHIQQHSEDLRGLPWHVFVISQSLLLFFASPNHKTLWRSQDPFDSKSSSELDSSARPFHKTNCS